MKTFLDKIFKLLIFTPGLFLLLLFFAMTAHALTHEIVNGVDVYSMPASTTNQIELPITATDNLKHYDLSVDSIEPALFAGLEAAISKTGSFFTYLISGQLSNTNTLFSVTERIVDFTIRIKDKFDAVGSKLFRLKVLNQRPVIDRISCSYITKEGIATSTDNAIGQNLFARKNTQINCQGYGHDDDGNAIDIIFSGYPEGLSQNIDSGFLTGLLYHDTSDYTMVARPRDEFGLEGDSVSFQLHIFGTYCGDGIYQYINDEGVNEQCDGASNIAYTPGQSYTGYYQFLMAYACNNNCQWGNGWCGDGTCNSGNGENTQTCSIDCGYDIIISANTPNFNLYNTARAYGWNGSRAVTLNVIINPGVYVYSNSTALPAFNTSSGYPSGTILNLTNNGYIIGAGGAGGAAGAGNAYAPWPGGPGGSGGAALGAQNNIVVINNGTIAGGGGGGGGGGGATQGDLNACYCGGGAGGGAGYIAGSGGNGCGCGGYPSGPGTSGSMYYGGVGANGTGFTGGDGGDGGGLGQAGGGGDNGSGFQTSAGGAGGAAGAAIVNNYLITWANTGAIYGFVQ